ncbi:phosphotransferase enzyme family protein [Bacillus salacetis]|uniref:phosphotransferase enzyme family protein n=1 Tax=Bacillus salacetis TaxID=2315464 RepID=UPI003B9E0CF4
MDDRGREEIALALGLESQSLRKLTGGLQNLIFENTIGQTVLRVSHSKRRTEEELLAEQHWLEILVSEGVKINEPHLFSDGDRIKEICLEKEPFLITQFGKIEGEGLDPSTPSHWNVEIFEKWGSMAGKLHKNGNAVKLTVKQQKAVNRKSDDKLYRELLMRDRYIARHYQRLLSEIDKLSKDDSCYGLSHRDLHHGNLLYSNGEIHIIDSDDFGYSWFAEDIATALYHVNWHGKSIHSDWKELHKDFLEAFARGYNQVSFLSQEIKDAIPLFLRKREFFLYNLFLQVWELDNLEEWQSFTLKQLEENLRNEIIPIQL